MTDPSAQVPAPKTFAPSRDDVLSNLAFFFGDPGARPPVRPSFSPVCPANQDFCQHRLTLCCPRSFTLLAAVPEKLRDYSEHHAM